jgi:hypothetical protein
VKALKRVMRDTCTQCNGNTLGVPCSACEGRGFVRVRCGQCWKWQAVNQFIGAKGGIVQNCGTCRGVYSNWGSKTLAERSAATKPRERLRGDGALRVPFVLRSGNRKTGPIPVTMTSARTCPQSCALFGKGCYAEGHMIAMHWRRLSNDLSGVTWSAFVELVRALPEGQLWRHNEAGDLPGDNETIDSRALAELVLANDGRRGFTYTHKPLTPENVDLIRGANDCGFVVNLSTDSLAAADDAAELGLPVVTVLPSNAVQNPTAHRTPSGRRIVVCPAVLREEITCATCQLCAVGKRKTIVGFPAHGDRKGQVTERLRQLPMFKEAPRV